MEWRENTTMLWNTLYNRIGKKSAAISGKQHVHMLSMDPKTGNQVITFLELRHDVCGNPYLVKSDKRYENPHRPLKRHKTDANAPSKTAGKQDSDDGRLAYDLTPVAGGWRNGWVILQAGGKLAALPGELGERTLVFETPASAAKYQARVTMTLRRLLVENTGMSPDEAAEYLNTAMYHEIRCANDYGFDDDYLVYVVDMA